MAVTTHRAVTEFRLRPVIAGLKVLDGVPGVRAAIEGVSPANGRTVLAALRALVDGESTTIYGAGLHRSDLFYVRALIKELEATCAVTAGTTGDIGCTDANFASAKASSDPAEQVLRGLLVTKEADFIPGFTGVGINNAGRF